MRYTLLSSLLSSAFLLSACSDNDTDEKKKIDYSVFDDAAVTQLVDEGNYARAVEIIREQEKLGITDQADYLALVRIYLELQNGIAAEVAIDRAVEKGADEKELGLEKARALFLQNKMGEARQKLDEAALAPEEFADAELLRGDIANNDGKVADARTHYLAAIEANPTDFRGQLALAMLELAQGNLVDADKAAAAAAQLTTDNGLVSYAQGMVKRYEGNNSEALTHLVRAVELQPSNLMVHLELAGIYIDDGKQEQAQKELDVIYGMAPEHPMAHYYTALMQAQSGELRKAEALLLRTGDLSKNYPPAARTYGLVAYQLQKFSTAEPYLERFLQLVPADRVVRLALSECLVSRGKAGDALKTLAPLLTPEAGDQEAYLQAAAAASALGDLKRARSYFEAADKMAPPEGDDTPARKRLLEAKIALAQYLSGDTAGAQEKLKALYPAGEEADDDGLIMLANMQLRSGDVVGAEKTAVRMTSATKPSAAAYNVLGAVRYRQGQLDDAIAAYSKALDLNPKYESALKNRGLAYLRARKLGEAQQDLTSLAKTAPNDAQVQAMLGRVLLELEKPKDALPYLKQARTVIPASAVIATDYAEALAGAGLMSSAIEQAHEAKKLAGDRTDLVTYLTDLLGGWEKAEAEKKEAERLAREKARDEAVRQREAREKEAAERLEAARLAAEKEKAEREKAKKEAAEKDGDNPDAAKPDDPSV